MDFPLNGKGREAKQQSLSWKVLYPGGKFDSSEERLQVSGSFASAVGVNLLWVPESGNKLQIPITSRSCYLSHSITARIQQYSQ